MESDEDAGSTFTFYVPQQSDNHESEPPIVDDDMRNLFALTSLLEQQGMAVFTAESSKEAIEKLNDMQDIDIVLMDIMMPEMAGYEAMQKIRSDPKFKDLPIIALRGVM